MSIGDTDDRVAAIGRVLVAEPDDATAAFIRALVDDAVKVSGERVFIVRDGVGTDPVSGQPVTVPDDAEDVMNNNRLRGELDIALAAMRLLSPDLAKRRDAVARLTAEPSAVLLPLLDKALAAEPDASLKARLVLAREAALLGSDDAAQRLQAAKALAASKTPATQLLLNQRLAEEADPAVRSAITA
ncbi:MAG: urea ABC transporter permease subunit UrtB, partial [Burkholderiaceae bacterium]|nr:urea ABC transporter permease subunit UrtB [Burkholderiaceae bacterium]